MPPDPHPSPPMPPSPAPRLGYDPAKTVVVVSGLPRSGTSMMMQMLAAGGIPPYTDGQRAPDDSNPRGYYEHARVKTLDRDNAWLPEARGHAVKIVASLLPHLLPGLEYKIIFMWRSLAEVLRSQDAMLGQSVESGGEAGRLLAESFARQLDHITQALPNSPGVDVLYIDHAAAVSDPATVARDTAAFLGTAFDIDQAAAAVDPQLHRQR